MGSGGSSRRKDTDDGEYDSDQDQYDQGNTYDNSSMEKEQHRQAATQVLKALQGREMIVTSPGVLGSLIGSGGLHLSREDSVRVLEDLSKSETQMLKDVLAAHADSDVPQNVKDKLFEQWQMQQDLRNARKKRARN